MKLAYGTVGSIMEVWIKHAHVGKYFSLSLTFLREKSIVVRSVFISICPIVVVISVFLKRSIQLGLSKGIPLSLKVQKESRNRIEEVLRRGLMYHQIHNLKSAKTLERVIKIGK